MEMYLVYEFINSNMDECNIEDIEFFGIYDNETVAKNVAKERLDYGLNNCNVEIEEAFLNIDNPFETTNSVELYRENSNYESLIYSINIKKMKLNEKVKGE